MTRLTNSSDGSHKFWDAHVDGTTLVVRFGRIGTDGQTQEKAFSSSAAAQQELEKKAAEKMAKGYVAAAAGKKATKATPAKATTSKAKATTAKATTTATPAKATTAKAKAPTAKATTTALGGIDKTVLAWFHTEHPHDQDVGAFEALVGPVPPDLRRFGVRSERPELDGSVFHLPFSNLASSSDNAFERVLDSVGIARKKPLVFHTEVLIQFFTGCFVLGVDDVANGDVYAVFIGPEVGRNAYVTTWDHEVGEFGDIVGLDLPSAAYYWYARDAHGDDPKAFAKALKNVKKTLDLHASPWSDGLDDDPALAAFSDRRTFDGGARENTVSELDRQSRWIVNVLSAGRLDPDSVPDDVFEADPAELRDPTWRAYPPVLLYWLWRSFLLDEKATLSTALALAAKSPAKIVRDAVTLVRELDSGRKTLGRIADVAALRTEVKNALPKILATRTQAQAKKQQAERQVNIRHKSGIHLVPVDGEGPAVLFHEVRVLPGGGQLRVDDVGIFFSPKGAKERRVFAWGESWIPRWWSLHPAGDRILLPANDNQLSSAELVLATGGQTLLHPETKAGAYLPDGRVLLYLPWGDYDQLVVFADQQAGGTRAWKEQSKQSKPTDAILDPLPCGVVTTLESQFHSVMSFWTVSGKPKCFAELKGEPSVQFQRAWIEGGAVRVLTNVGVFEVKGIEAAVAKL